MICITHGLCWVTTPGIVQCVCARVHNKEEESIKHAICSVWEVFGKSRARNFNESARFKYLIVGLASNQAKESTILSKNARRTWYRTNVWVEAIIKITKSAITLTVSRKITFSSLVMCARRKVTLLSEDLLHDVHSEFDTLFFYYMYILLVCVMHNVTK